MTLFLALLKQYKTALSLLLVTGLVTFTAGKLISKHYKQKRYKKEVTTIPKDLTECLKIAKNAEELNKCYARFNL